MTINALSGPFIDGRTRHSCSDERVERVNPSNGEVLASLPVGNLEDAGRAVQSAKVAFESGAWSEASPGFRKNVLLNFATLIEAEAPSLDLRDATEMGKPVSEQFGNARAAASLVRYCAEAVDKIPGRVFPSDRKSVYLQENVPRGVVAAITPWNFPTFNSAIKIAPALAAGNCVIVKPSELATDSTVRLAELGVEAGLPFGVFNVVPGLGETVGAQLGLHRDVQMLTFTGSTAAGRRMFEYSARSNMKVVVAECGGKSPQIIFNDGVNLDDAADAVARSILTNQGQLCHAGTRLLVDRTIEAEFVDRIMERFCRIAIGDASLIETTFGPLASLPQLDRVKAYDKRAQAEGAQRITAGLLQGKAREGFYFEPVLFRNVSPHAAIAQEEIFGPILAVIPFATEAEAIEIANNTAFGLAAYIWTADLSRGLRVAKSIKSSAFVYASKTTGEGAAHGASYEPYNQSGTGIEGGLEGIETYLRRHTIAIFHA